MTVQEAISYLQTKAFQDYSGTPYEIAIEALEKQIPKSVVNKVQNENFHKQYCPTCGEELCNENYCVGRCECGQKLMYCG